MVTAVFAYLGTELVGVTVGEAENPRKTIPRAIRLTFFRIVFFYILSVLLVGMIVPYNSDKLAFATKQSNSAAASPFVVAIQLAGIKGLPGFLNACILIFVFSACNSDLYIASRTIHGLALRGQAPKILAKTDKRGVPYYSLGLSSLFCLLAYMNVSSSSKEVFGYFVNLTTIFGLLTWISILVTHIWFRRACKAQGVTPKQLPYAAPLGIWGSYFSLFWCCLIALTKNFAAFTHDKKTYGDFDYKNFITGYLGIPLYLILLFGYKFIKKSKGVKPAEADLFTGKDVFDRDEEYWKAVEHEKDAKRDGSWFYRTFLSWLF
ncbi:dicarboxylic amino acid permease, partial [Aureobasidium melanogenum]